MSERRHPVYPTCEQPVHRHLEGPRVLDNRLPWHAADSALMGAIGVLVPSKGPRRIGCRLVAGGLACCFKTILQVGHVAPCTVPRSVSIKLRGVGPSELTYVYVSDLKNCKRAARRAGDNLSSSPTISSVSGDISMPQSTVERDTPASLQTAVRLSTVGSFPSARIECT